MSLQEILCSPAAAPAPRRHRHPEHRLLPSPDCQVVKDGVRKYRHCSCKVCSLLRTPGKRGANSKWFCEGCSDGNIRLVFSVFLRVLQRLLTFLLPRIYLCNVVRDFQRLPNNALTCYQLWHDAWACGDEIPPTITRYKRPAAGESNKRRRRLQVPDADDNASADVGDAHVDGAHVEVADEPPATAAGIMVESGV